MGSSKNTRIVDMNLLVYSLSLFLYYENLRMIMLYRSINNFHNTPEFSDVVFLPNNSIDVYVIVNALYVINFALLSSFNKTNTTI